MESKSDHPTKKPVYNDGRKRGALYDTDRLKEIPILSVCSQLNIPIEKKYGRRAWCKVRQERTASTMLDLDKNTFFDYGDGGHGGDVIAFYAYVTGISQGEAMKELGNHFGIPSKDPRAGLKSNDLTNFEWSKIGLYGDRASKNYSFDVERLPIERCWELSEQFNMSMNDLRKAFPEVYEKMLREKALPYLRELRNHYYLNIYGEYRFALELGNTDLFYDQRIQEDLLHEKEHLITAERLLEKAARNTAIHFEPGKSYEPDVVLKQLLRGDHKLGTLSHKQMQARARARKCYLKYCSFGYADYESADFSDILHTAFLRGDRVFIGYLPSDEQKVQSILNPVCPTAKEQRSSQTLPTQPKYPKQEHER